MRDVSPRLLLSIKDDGVGVDGRDDRRIGFGLIGIQERVREINGVASIHSGREAGTTLLVDIPIPPRPEARDESAAS